MFTSISNLLYKFAKWRFIIPFLFLFILMMYIIPFVPIDPGLANNESLDLPSFNSPEKIYNLLKSYGENGRSQIIILAITWDLLFPISYTFFFGLLISWLLRHGIKPQSKLRLLNLVALAGIFDLLENISSILLVSLYPIQSYVIAYIKSSLTIIKYSFGIPIFIILIFSFIMAIRNHFHIQE